MIDFHLAILCCVFMLIVGVFLGSGFAALQTTKELHREAFKLGLMNKTVTEDDKIIYQFIDLTKPITKENDNKVIGFKIYKEIENEKKWF